MKSYNHFFENMLKPNNVCYCMLEAAKGKMWRREVFNALVNFDKTYEFIIKCARNPDFKPCEDNRHQIIDGANHKKREIEKPRFCPEQILHHVIIEPFKQVVMNGLYEQVYGCLPRVTRTDRKGRVITRNFGPHAAIRKLQKWIQTGKKVYVCETDIHHAYGSVKIATLVKQLQHVIKDTQWLELVYKFLHYDAQDIYSEDLRGLTLGHFTSPWFFNFYLKDFDHFAAAIKDVKYLRFADNIFMVSSNKRRLHKALDAIREYIRQNLSLELNKSTKFFLM